MTNDYDAVGKALSTGADPAMLCGMCPWDRHCISPPTMTRADIDSQIADATRKDEQAVAERKAAGQDAFPVGLLLTTLVVAGRDKSALVCPVFALRLRSSGGRRLADGFKETMQSWDDAR